MNVINALSWETKRFFAYYTVPVHGTTVRHWTDTIGTGVTKKFDRQLFNAQVQRTYASKRFCTRVRVWRMVHPKIWTSLIRRTCTTYMCGERFQAYAFTATLWVVARVRTGIQCYTFMHGIHVHPCTNTGLGICALYIGSLSTWLVSHIASRF